MKIRVSHLFQFTGIIFFIIGLFLLWKGHPINPINYNQATLYESSLYSYLVKEGKKTKAWVIAINPEKNSPINLAIKFFTHNGALIKTTIYNAKVNYEVGEFVNILYSPIDPHEVRINPADETSLGWDNFGWFFIMGFILYLTGHIRKKKSDGLE